MITPETPEQKNGRSWKKKLVRQFILANPGATIPEIVKSTRTAARTVGRVRKELIKTGKIAPPAIGRPPSVSNLPTLSDEEEIRRDIDAQIAAGGVTPLTREQRRQRLSLFADHPKVPHASRIAALRELESTETGDKGPELGPGAPLTREDRIHRVALIIEALADTDGMQAAVDAIYQGRADLFLWQKTHAGVAHAEPNRSTTPLDSSSN